MGELVMGVLMPHPPVAVPQIGGNRISDMRRTYDALEKIADRIVKSSPDRLVVISPHSPLFSDAIAVLGQPELAGDFSQFGYSSPSYRYNNDLEFVRNLREAADELNLATVVIDERKARSYGVDHRLDHGALVPLHFIKEAGFAGSLVCMGFSMFSVEELFAFGTVLQKVIEESPGRTAVVASGDLSHRLTISAPAGYSPLGSQFDEALMELLGKGDYLGVLTMDPGVVEGAGECGYRSVVILLGCTDGYETDPEILSYEGPFGVGYGVVDLKVGDKHGPKLHDRLIQRREDEVQQARAGEDEFVGLCRRAIEAYVRNRTITDPPSPVPSEMHGRAGVFCSIKKNGQLRGCIGTIEPVRQNIAEEIIHNAIAAATDDPRFPEVRPDELPWLTYSVDVLGKPEPIEGMHQLDPKRYGVIVSSGHRRGLLLPNLEGVDTVEEQVRIARQKAGISRGENATLQRFEVIRHK